MIIVNFILAVLGIGVLVVFLPILLVAASVSSVGWIVRSLLALQRLRDSIAAWKSERAQVLQRLSNRLQSDRSGQMA